MNHVQPPPHQEELLDYELRVARYGWRKWGAWLCTPRGRWTAAVLGVVLLLVWQAPTILRAIRVQRVLGLIAKSEAARSRGDTATEGRLLTEAFQLLPADARVWRARARHYESYSESVALVTYHTLLTIRGATVEDAARACRLASLRAAPETGAQMLAVAERVEGAARHPAFLALRARILAARGDWSEAIALAERAAEAGEAAAPERLSLAMLLLRANERGDAAERTATGRRAVAMLDILAQQMDATGRDALTALVGLAQNPRFSELVAGHDVRTWLAATERHPAADAALQVRAWNLRLASERDAADQVFADFVARWREAEPAAGLEAARWLNLQGRPLLSLEISEPHRDLSEDWFLVHLEALGATQQWAQARDRLETPTGPATTLARPLRAVFLLTARAKVGEPVQPDEVWRDIQLQLQTEPVRIRLFIARYAEASGENKQAAAIYRGVLSDFAANTALDLQLHRETKLACYTGLLRNLPATAPAADVAPYVQALAEDFPEIESARGDALYLRALAGEKDAALREEIAQWRQRAPSSDVAVVTAALIALRAGEAAEASRLLDAAPIDWRTAPDRWKAVRVAALTAAGRAEDAQALRTRIRASHLRPEEAALLR